MRSLVFFIWSLLEHLHTLKFATDLSGMADLDGQTLLLLATLGITLMTYRKLGRQDGDRRAKPRRRARRSR
jgi:hypothetical protein